MSQAVERSFNEITVESDTRTDDILLALAAGEPLSSKHFDAAEVG